MTIVAALLAPQPRFFSPPASRWGSPLLPFRGPNAFSARALCATRPLLRDQLNASFSRQSTHLGAFHSQMRVIEPFAALKSP